MCVKLQYVVSTYLQLDCLYLKKQIYSETFCPIESTVNSFNKMTKHQMIHVCYITKSGTREVSTSRSHISASNHNKNTILSLF